MRERDSYTRVIYRTDEGVQLYTYTVTGRLNCLPSVGYLPVNAVRRNLCSHDARSYTRIHECARVSRHSFSQLLYNEQKFCTDRRTNEQIVMRLCSKLAIYRYSTGWWYLQHLPNFTLVGTHANNTTNARWAEGSGELARILNGYVFP